LKKLLYFCSFALFLALSPLPAVYYRLLRFLITIAAILVVKDEWNKQYSVGIWLVLFATIAFIFNPILPVHLYNRITWLSIDVMSALVFMLKASIYTSGVKKDN